MPVIHNDDKVWFDEARKLEQIGNQVSAARADGCSVLLLSHFESAVASLASLLQKKEISPERFSALNPSELCMSAPGKVWLGSARSFQVVHEATAPSGDAALDIIVAEHHPMQSRDQEIVNAAAKLSCTAELCFYFSLDDPVMKLFDNESIKTLLERLGMEKKECISHPLVTKAIRNAQEKIERKVGKDVPTYSADDWFKYNLPGKI